MAILQWNCRGFSSNRSDIDLLISRYGPEVLCLQETLLRHPCHPITGFCHYDLLASLDDRGRPHGGVVILAKTNIPHKEVQLTTSLKAIAIRVTLQKTITICSLYIRPSSTVNTKDLNDLVQQLPSPFIILGDFNAHTHSWEGIPVIGGVGSFKSSLLIMSCVYGMMASSPTLILAVEHQLP